MDSRNASSLTQQHPRNIEITSQGPQSIFYNSRLLSQFPKPFCPYTRKVRSPCSLLRSCLPLLGQSSMSPLFFLKLLRDLRGGQ